MSDEAGTIRVRAMANVLGMTAGDVADVSKDTYDLYPCINRGLVMVLDGSDPTPPKKAGCGCGG